MIFINKWADKLIKKTVDKIKIGVKGKQNTKVYEFYSNCNGCWQQMWKVLPRPCQDHTNIPAITCLNWNFVSVLLSIMKIIFPFAGDFVQRRLIWRLFLRGRSTGSRRPRCGLLLERFSWSAKNQYHLVITPTNHNRGKLCDKPIRIPSNDL